MTKRNNNKYFNYSLLSILVAIFALAISSCRDNDFDFEEQYPGNAQKQEYTNFWIEEIGEMDPTHDWNMVTQVSAHIRLSDYEDLTGSQIKVFTDDPYKENSRLLACYDVTAHEMEIKFDVLKSINNVFILRERQNGYFAMVVCEILDNKCIANFAGQSEDATRALAGTRAGIDYPTTVPTDAEKIDGTYDNNFELDYNHAHQTIQLDGTTLNGKASFLQPNLKIYVTGDVTINELVIGQNNAKIYVLNGATLTIKNGDFNKYNSIYTICPGGSMVVEKDPDFNGATLNNGGRFEAKENLTFPANFTFNNECKFYVDGELKIHQGSFTNTSFIKCGSLAMTNTKMVLNANTQFVVEGTAHFGYNGYNSSYGIYSSATDADKAVFKANNITTEGSQCATFSGNLIVDCANLPTQSGSATTNDYNWWLFNGAVLASSGDNYEIPGGDCNEEYAPNKPDIPESDPVAYIIACEDLGDTDDYDFNDIVLKVSHVSGRTTATVTPLAAGGTLKAYWGFGTGTTSIGGEFHTQFGNSTALTYNESLCMLNTGKEYPNIKTNRLTGTPQTITVAADFSLANNTANQTNMGGFWISVEQTSSSSTQTSAITITAPTPYIQNTPSSVKQTAPQMLLLPDGWRWPKERMPITLAYPNFINWNSDATLANWQAVMDESVVY